MRPFLAGVHALIFFVLTFAPTALGQASGWVESIGFENHYRPECWTPMVITLQPQTSEALDLQIRVKQEDLDRDRVVYVRNITLTGNPAGGGMRVQKFRMYFKPQPTDGGLPHVDANPRFAGGGSPFTKKDLSNVLKVSLHTAGGKFIDNLPIMTAMPMNLDAKAGPFEYRRGLRLVLVVAEGTAPLNWMEYQRSLGVTEDVAFVRVRTQDLPENVIGYEAADSILWLNADPAELKSGGDEKFRALEGYVRRGGRLVISQPAEWQKTAAFGELLPVRVLGVGNKSTPTPLSRYARPRSRVESADPWRNARGPFPVARGLALPGAIVEDWVDWNDDGKDKSPWLVRKTLGLGSVTWVAHDLASPVLSRQAPSGWPRAWDKIFDWPNDTLVVTNATPSPEKDEYAPASGVDLGTSVLRWLELQSRSMWLVTLAVLFFIGYWLVAGPGVYVYLLAKKRSELSWFLFALTALLATGLTMLLVRVTLRGPPDLRHISFVQMAPNQPAVVRSRFGLYIPRDGEQRIELKETAPNTVSTITPFAIPPAHLKDPPQNKGPEYRVPVREASSLDPVAISVPYRSTLKKFEADWVGVIPRGIEGSAKLVEQGWIEGTLKNATGHPLRNVYIAFKYRNPGANWTDDYVLYKREWPDGATWDLKTQFNVIGGADGKTSAVPMLDIALATPESHTAVRGRISPDIAWVPYWYRPFRGTNLSERSWTDEGERIRRAIPLLTFFDRLPPAKNEKSGTPSRFELLRRGVRDLDLSGALGSGSLLVVAETDDQQPIPIPLEVEGEPVKGSGSIIFQCVLPLENSLASAPATQPSE